MHRVYLHRQRGSDEPREAEEWQTLQRGRTSEKKRRVRQGRAG